jgi:catechol 2,3-dioxygenase-like lactoylglutathione lyase family enzyme
MAGLFGPIAQIGMVVRDIEAAMAHWGQVCGVGPWFYMPRYPLPRFSYRGVERPGPDLAIALAYSGEMQLELIQQRCATPSMYRDFLDAGLEGMQHWAFWAEDYDAALARALAAGQHIGQAGDATGRGRFAYLDSTYRDSTGPAASVVEIVELTPARAAGFARIKAAAAGWDGSDPIRLL